ncbi:uncharacterized protein F5891DRAFT_975214 [Suillus fuscotomentosus]|uniref:Uncharacterized protein n=1 Tax=Suillus fuscotomentosus TaxID=1912939 RepID=A0AAD4EHY5_9AGAM|nr:uncharacterized protein F5891DRAFT_975214 [Suillus fuscotomentosus]KAG1906396.1 hypothetical protein F5891DRAFT_975214 [Suillus fuscotomentosus]
MYTNTVRETETVLARTVKRTTVLTTRLYTDMVKIRTRVSNWRRKAIIQSGLIGIIIGICGPDLTFVIQSKMIDPSDGDSQATRCGQQRTRSIMQSAELETSFI